ncbi:ABC transporter permease [Aldersonia sp. NBC_00410]|uniref:ABC transporter permease n=1 Tax=Aldersonia sp. NBC_00410 TaxID=2975954 RepID=UPI002256D61B|nr:ABC transporter permease [Aldersonia sp. NBC_00410]MCX5045882.1 ABC transporter permease [Aldersonia sp. NBC_00410]
MTVSVFGTDNRRVEPSKVRQWSILTNRVLLNLFNSGQILIAFVTPVIFTLGFYLPLRYVMGVQGIDYAQFVMPIIALQTVGFAMTSNAQIAAFETLSGLNDRLHTMPIASFVPLAARITGGMLRAGISLAVAIGLGYLIGFRFEAGFWQGVLFVVFTFAVGTVLSLGADALGVLTRSPESLSQALTLPILIFGMLSAGFVPETGFPEWIQPFVRNQPISQFAVSMQDMTTDGVTFHVLWPALAWLGGMVALFVPLAIWASGRRQ